MHVTKEDLVAAFAPDGPVHQILWGPIGIILILCQASIFYTYCNLIPTLAIVEDTQAKSRKYIDSAPPAYTENLGNGEKTRLLVEEAEVEIEAAAPTKPITSSVFGTIRHLRSNAGYLAHLRGVGIALAWSFIVNLGPQVFARLARSVNPPFLVALALVSNVGTARLNMLWTHVVMTKPSPKPWFRRFAPRSAFRKIALPTLAWAITQPTVSAAPALVAYLLFFKMGGPALDPNATAAHAHNCRAAFVFVAKGLAVVLTWIMANVFVWLPVQVMFIRCQAALLPEDEEPIIPFDRTFGGAVVPESEGGSGRLRMKAAWRSFDWNSRVRLVKVYIKGLGMLMLPLVLGLSFAAVQIALF